MSQGIPLELKVNPIIDAVIEIRFESSISFSDILPGVLLQTLGDEIGAVDRLPAADIPKQMRDHDQNLFYQPLVRIALGDYAILVGDRVVALACKIPYPGGSEFKEKAVEIFCQVLSLAIIKKVDRVSMKYVDFIEGDTLGDVIPYLNFSMSIGDNAVHEKNSFDVRLQIPEDDFLHLVQIIAPVEISVQARPQKKGLLIEVDTILIIKDMNADSVRESFSGLIDSLHLANKNKFFSLLTSHALNKLEAKY